MVLLTRIFTVFALFWAAVLPAGAEAVQHWRIVALRVDFPLEDPDEPTTTGTGRFDLRTHEEALPGYRLPFDTPPHDRRYFERHLHALARYYRTVSQGKVEIDFAVYPRENEAAYTLPQAMLFYGSGRTEEEIGRRWIQLFGDAVALAEADPDGPRFADFNSFLVFHAGVGYETGELNDIRSVFLEERNFATYGDGPLLADGGTFQIRQGWILPETPSLRGQAGLNGLLAKFFGHQVGLPGLSNFADGLPAVGGWSLMDVGANRFGFMRQTRPGQPDTLLLGVGFVPPHPMAWSKARLGWLEPLKVVRDTTVELLATDRSGEQPKAVRIPLDTDEYLLLENRQMRGQRGIPAGVASSMTDSQAVVWIGEAEIDFSREDQTGTWLGVAEYEAYIPGSGVLVWHVDEGVIREREERGGINNDPVHPGIALKEADGYRDIGNPVFARLDQIEGSPDDPFFVGGQTLLGPDTWPNTRTYRGWDSGVEIEVRSPPGDLMRVDIRFPKLAPGWPRQRSRGRRLQAAELAGKGRNELIVQQERGLFVLRDDGSEGAAIEGAVLLAASAVDDDAAALFVWRDGKVERWRYGKSEPEWSVALDFVPRAALVATLGLFSEPVLALGGDELVLLDARRGESLRRLAGRQVYSLTAAVVETGQEPELLALDDQGSVWRLTGEELGLWQTLGEGPFLPPAAGDLDGDGRMELVLAARRGVIEVLQGSDVVFRRDLQDSLVAGPAIGDVSGDGLLEIVLVGVDQVHVVQAGGLLQADFPVRLPRSAAAQMGAATPLLLDLDGDGKQEILLGTTRGLFGLDHRGRWVAGFPLLTQEAIVATPVAADLSGDGRRELAALAGDWLYVWNPQRFVPAYAGQRADWEQEGGSAAGVRAHVRRDGKPLPDPQAGLLPAGRVYCYPNPVEGESQAHLRYFLNRPAQVRLEVFDAIGARVERHERWESAAPAEHEFVWSVRGYASGLYICRLEARGEGGGREVVFVKLAVSR